MTAGERAWQDLVADLTGGVEGEVDFGAGPERCTRLTHPTTANYPSVLFDRQASMTSRSQRPVNTG
jgi:hypothetical protein